MLSTEITFKLEHGTDVELVNYTDGSKNANRQADLFEKHCIDVICRKAANLNARQFSTKNRLTDFKFFDLPDAMLNLIIDSGLINDIKNHVKRFNFQVESYYNENWQERLQPLGWNQFTKDATDKFVSIIKATCSAHMFAYKTGAITNNKLMLFAETVDNQEEVL